jgi:hypothetical protein
MLSQNSFKMVFFIFILTLFFTGLWALDIGVSVLNLENVGIEVEAKGLGFARDGCSQYHIGLILAMLCFVVLSIMYVLEVTKT